MSWIPFDIGGTDQHRIVTMVDPLTGLSRIIIGDDQGVFSAVDDNGTFDLGIGTAQEPGSDRNGNLQITQFYYGSSQPTNVAADLAQALFYGSTQDNGGPASDPNIIGDPTQPGYGDLNWNGPGGDATGVGTNQQAGTVDPNTGQVISPRCTSTGGPPPAAASPTSSRSTVSAARRSDPGKQRPAHPRP